MKIWVDLGFVTTGSSLMQSSKHRTYGMLIRTCSKNIDQDSLDWLWTTCLAKILLTET